MFSTIKFTAKLVLIHFQNGSMVTYMLYLQFYHTLNYVMNNSDFFLLHQTANIYIFYFCHLYYLLRLKFENIEEGSYFILR